MQCVNGTILPRFYMFKGKKLCDDYIKLCKARTYMAMLKRTWTKSFLFKEFLSFFKRFIPGGISQTNIHLLILDEHGSHVHCYVRGNRTNTRIWFRHDHFSLSHITCILATRYLLFQAFQDNTNKGNGCNYG